MLGPTEMETDMPLDDLTGNWIDNQGAFRRVSPDPERPGDDVWLVTNPNYTSHVNRYDGDTIRTEWTLVLRTGGVR